MFNITCSGPGPHDPADGILGTSDQPQTADVRCASAACVKPIDPQTANQSTLQQQAQTALTNNRTYLAGGSPTTAQAVAQVAALTRQNQGIIRLLLNQFDGTN